MIKKKINKILNKKYKTKIVCLTSYSSNTAGILDKYCDIVLVGDSLANVLYGMPNTHKLSIEIMMNHSISVRKKIKKSLLVVDMPKNSYQTEKEAIKNAKLILKKTRCDAIKIESNKKNFNIIKNLVSQKIPVMGHIGFTPQYKQKFKVEGVSLSQRKNLIAEAKEIERAGAFSIVLECVSMKTAEKVTNAVKIPTIGIGSSNMCDGQILVTDDLLGLSGFYPKFVKRYVKLNKIIDKAVKKYSKDVKLGKFPKTNNSFK